MRKGDLGYLRRKRLFSCLKSLLLLSAVLAVFFTAKAVFHTEKTVFSILAAVGALPAGRSIVVTVMCLRAKGASKEAEEAIEAVLCPAGDSPRALEGACGYDLCLTSYERSFCLSHAAAGAGRIIALTEDPGTDPELCRRHIEETLEKGGQGNWQAEVFTDLRAYVKALAEAAAEYSGEKTSKGSAEDSKGADAARAAMKVLAAVSL